MLIDGDGRVLAEADSDDGIGGLKPGEHEAAFDRLVADWPAVPAIMAGMVGSRQGWREAVYVSCPATPEAIAGGILRFATAKGRPVAIVPGVMVRSPDRDGDVIRGEETQIVGLLAREPEFDGVVILPGTHSKWATVSGGAIADFQTYLTGEMFGLLAHQSFLRHSVKEGARGSLHRSRTSRSASAARSSKACRSSPRSSRCARASFSTASRPRTTSPTSPAW